LMAIALQAMVNSEAAGVAFIQDGEMTVEAVYGLACGLVSGSCAADSIVWSSRSGAPIIKTMRKEAAWLVNPCSHAVWHGQRVRFGYAFSRSLPLRILGSDPYQAILKCEVPEEMRDTPVLEETDVEKVGSCLYRVFDTFNRADLDIEWCLTTERDVSILQVRPTTAELPHSSISRAPPSEAIQGIAISPGVASGKAVVVSAAGDIPRVQRGSVVVVDHLDRALIGVLAKASALVTEETTVLSHHAIVAREWQVPCVGGIRKATISEGRVYLVDGTAGTLTPK
jgi:pyruvate,water dikinase